MARSFFNRSALALSVMAAVAIVPGFWVRAAPPTKGKPPAKQTQAKPAKPSKEAAKPSGGAAKSPANAKGTAAETSDAAGIAFFERKIRPVLVEHCYSCHSQSAEKLKANLYCDSRDAMLSGGDSGPAIVPGNPGKSLLIKAVQWTDQDLQMPPKTQLPPAVVADLTRWVQMGAPWPADRRKDDVAALPPQPDRWAQSKATHWAWQTVRPVQPPAVKDSAWPRSDVDRFLLARLETQGLRPVGDADRVTLIRRVTYDLTGLPPRPDDVVAFAGDKSPNAFEKVVDRLLASPQFGERWGRHWLDVARYSESTGSTRNYPYQHAWRYRDYVIDAFNADKPYDQFITEQLAGDLMPGGDAAETNERLIATGYLAMGVKDLNERNRDKFVMDNVDEQIDTVSRSLLATTIACARCHDHKFDPISTAEYYQVAGIFRSTEILSGLKNRQGGGNRAYEDGAGLIRLLESGPSNARTTPAESKVSRDQQLADLQAKLQNGQARIRQMMSDAGLKPEKAEAKKLGKSNPALLKKVAALRQELQSIKAEIARLEAGDKTDAAPADKTAALAIGVRDAGSPADCRINIRGDHDNLGAAVPRGVVGVIQGPSIKPIASDESGRLQLAAWIASPQNPLTARVMVNRIWHHLFGAGLVRTMDNFGTTGETPSHPELLDHLADRFVQDGWSVKKMIRSLVLSRAYQLASSHDARNYQADPGNTLVWKHSLRRLDAEEVRDAMLFVGQSLDLSRPAGSPVADLPAVELRENRRGSAIDRSGGNHRSVYVPVVRSLVQPMMDTFDFAEPTMVTGERDVTTVATQALFLMNNEFSLQQSRRLAEMLLQDSSIGNDDARLDHAYGWTLGRSATAAEKARAMAYLGEFSAGNATRADAWTSLVQALIASAEFRYVQ